MITWSTGGQRLPGVTGAGAAGAAPELRSGRRCGAAVFPSRSAVALGGRCFVRAQGRRGQAQDGPRWLLLTLLFALSPRSATASPLRFCSGLVLGVVVFFFNLNVLPIHFRPSGIPPVPSPFPARALAPAALGLQGAPSSRPWRGAAGGAGPGAAPAAPSPALPVAAGGLLQSRYLAGEHQRGDGGWLRACRWLRTRRARGANRWPDVVTGTDLLY